MLTRGNEIVARALGAGGREDRRRDLQKAVLHHRLPQGGDDVAAQDDVLLHGGISQIEVAILEAVGLVGLAAAVDLKRQLVIDALAEHLDLLGHDLNVAGGELGVLARALAHDALDGDGALLVEGLDNAHHVLGLDDDLRRAVKIAQDDEGKVLSDLADVLHPANQADALADVLHAQLIAVVGTILKHVHALLSME